MGADALAPAAMVLGMQYKRALVLHKEASQLLAPFPGFNVGKWLKKYKPIFMLLEIYSARQRLSQMKFKIV